MELNMSTTKTDIVKFIRAGQHREGDALITDWRVRQMTKEQLLDVAEIYAGDDVVIDYSNVIEMPEFADEDDDEDEVLDTSTGEAQVTHFDNAAAIQVDLSETATMETVTLPVIDLDTMQVVDELEVELTPAEAARVEIPVVHYVAEGEGTKHCSWHKCHHPIVDPETGKPNFSVNRSSKDGLDGRCKIGWTEYKKARKSQKEN